MKTGKQVISKTKKTRQRQQKRMVWVVEVNHGDGWSPDSSWCSPGIAGDALVSAQMADLRSRVVVYVPAKVQP